MPKKTKSSPAPARRAKSNEPAAANPAKTSARSTVSGPSRRAATAARDAATAKLAVTEIVAEAFPFNAAKPSEFEKAALTPQPAP